VILTDEQFAALREYLERQHSLTYHPDEVGLTVALGAAVVLCQTVQAALAVTQW
jgi:hypothetical protein